VTKRNGKNSRMLTEHDSRPGDGGEWFRLAELRSKMVRLPSATAR
jgi:hypothetical protein